MKNYTLTDGVYSFEAANHKFALVVTVAAVIAISKRFGSLNEALKVVDKYDVESCMFVLNTGIAEPITDEIREKIYKEIGLVGIAVHALNFINYLFSGGKEEEAINDDKQEQSKGKSKGKP